MTDGGVGGVGDHRAGDHIVRFPNSLYTRGAGNLTRDRTDQEERNAREALRCFFGDGVFPGPTVHFFNAETPRRRGGCVKQGDHTRRQQQPPPHPSGLLSGQVRL